MLAFEPNLAWRIAIVVVFLLATGVIVVGTIVLVADLIRDWHAEPTPPRSDIRDRLRHLPKP